MDRYGQARSGFNPVRMVSIRRSAVPRSNRNDNFIDKSFTVMASILTSPVTDLALT